MLKHRVRNLAVAGFMIASALVLTVPFAPSASASTPATCVTSDVPWSCVQEFGNGISVQDWNGWAHNQTRTVIYHLHIELYWDFNNAVPPRYGNLFLNCPEFPLGAGLNSSNCSSGGPLNFGGPVYLCSAVWQHNGSQYIDLGWVCVHIT